MRAVMKKYIAWITTHRKFVVFLTLFITVDLLAQLRSLQVIIDPDGTLPQTHTYIAVGKLIEETFGNKFTIVIGISPHSGTVNQTSVLSKVSRITSLKLPGCIG